MFHFRFIFKKSKKYLFLSLPQAEAAALSGEKTHRKAASVGQTKFDAKGDVRLRFSYFILFYFFGLNVWFPSLFLVNVFSPLCLTHLLIPPSPQGPSNPFEKPGTTNPFAPASPKPGSSPSSSAALHPASLRHVEMGGGLSPQQRAEPDDPNRPGGYGGLAEEKAFEVNSSNPFAAQKKAAEKTPYNPFAPKAVEKTPSKAAPAKAKEKRPPPSREAYLEKLSGGKNK